MTARVLVVDDIPPNVRLLEAKLSAEYFDVITATSGMEAIEKAQTLYPDIILLDIMMPGMDGFEACQRLKADPATAHIPVVMVTALTDATDRVRGLEAGADDFLSKPVNDTALMARVRSLVRLKMTADEWHVRESTAQQFGFTPKKGLMLEEPITQANVLIVEDRGFEAEKLEEILHRDEDDVTSIRSGEEALILSQHRDFDIIVVSLNLAKEDGLKLCAQFRAQERTRSVPILVIAEEMDMPKIARALEIGAHDYILRPVDRNEFLARARTQVRRKRYQDRLRKNYEMSLTQALTDPLTALYNRRYFDTHFPKMLKRNADAKKGVCVMMLDLDHFKNINDTHGHSAGDAVLKEFAKRLGMRTRSFDLIARLGGEEFAVVLPDVSSIIAAQVGERLRKSVAEMPFVIDENGTKINVTVSIGATMIQPDNETPPDQALARADKALYRAKSEGRDRVCFD